MAVNFTFNPFTSNLDAVSLVTIGSPANGLSIDAAQVLTIGLSSTSTTGALSNTDWNTFNNKQSTITIGGLDAQAANANGLALVSNVLSTQSADATHPGMVNTTTQSFAGNKTFTGTIAASNLSGTNTGDVTLTAVGSSPSANGASLSGQALTLQPADGTTPGLLTALAQTIGGVKTFSSNPIMSALTASQAVVTDGAKALASLSYVSTATASTLMSRDSNANVNINAIIENFSTTVTASGTTTLTVSSSPTQQFTGTASQTVVFPNATTLTNGFIYYIINRSTASITIQANGGGALQTMVANSQAWFTLTNNGTAAGVWDVSYVVNALTIPIDPAELRNYSLFPTQSAGALSVAIRDATASANPSTSSPVKMQFMNAADMVTGGLKEISLTASSSVTAPSTSTLGLPSGVASFVYVYAIDSNAATPIEVGLSAKGDFDEAVLQSTTAISTGSTSATVMYSTTARSSRPVRLIGRLLVINTAGTWSTPTNGYNGYIAAKMDKAIVTAAGDLITATAAGTPSRVGIGTTAQILTVVGGTPTWTSPTPPTVQKFSSGTTYTTPAGVTWINVKAVGGGGGGGGSGTGAPGAGSTGGTTTFGTSMISCSGGTGGAAAVAGTGVGGGTGGTAGLGTGPIGIAMPGNYGFNSAASTPGGQGGGSAWLGGGGRGTGGATGIAGVANTGGGGGGSSNTTTAGAGGGGAGSVNAIIIAPASSYTYAIGTGGAGGAAGTSGNAGGAGADGFIEVIEYYN